ncbi:MAG: hypothetical protein J2O48_13615, partial [Solirubrobacterales bacterium]|nr:hypothetical protein [Solirubrobacterales bacterium]
PVTKIERYRERRRLHERSRRLQRNLPLAHRIAVEGACAGQQHEVLLEQAVVGLVEAADNFEVTDADCRFGAFAEPHIRAALGRDRDEQAIVAAQAELATAIPSQERVQELARFLECPAETLVGAA